MAGGLEERPTHLRDKPIHDISNPKIVFVQELADAVTCENLPERAHSMARLAARAVNVMAERGDIDWKTLQFQVGRTGTEPEGAEVWRWSAWTEA